MSDLEHGSTVGGSPILTQRNFPNHQHGPEDMRGLGNSALYDKSDSIGLDDSNRIATSKAVHDLYESSIDATNLSTGTVPNERLPITAIEYLPVGATYIQFPGYKSPDELFSGSWQRIFHTEGVFFRTEGGNASIFGGGIQWDAIRNLTGYVGLGATWGNNIPQGTGVFRRQYIKANERGGNNNGTGVSFDASRVVPVANENRPVNRTVRVWVRIL